MSKTIVFVHGAWVTPLCWEPFMGYFQGKGYQCVAPPWPYRDRPIEELRSNPPAELKTLGIAQIVDHFDKAIRVLDEPPILIGHSFGGLFVQMLLDRGLGKAGIAIDSAPPKGVLPFGYPSTLRSNLWILLTPGGWRKVIRQSFKDFRYAFVNTLPEADQKAAYERYVVPETGRIFFQSATSMFHDATKVNFRNDHRTPLLIIAGGADNNVTAGLNRDNYNRYRGSAAKTDFKVFEGRCHWIIAQPGWEEVAAYTEGWLAKLPV